VIHTRSYTISPPVAVAIFATAAGWCETEGTVTSSERRVQRVRRAVAPPPGVRDDIEIVYELARRLGHEWGQPDAESIWDEVRALSPMHAGMSYARLEALGGIQWPCYDEAHPGELFLHGRLWQEPLLGPRAPFSVVEFEPPVDQLDADYPIRLTTGRRLDSFNTGVQTERYSSPLRRDETLDLSPEDGASYGLVEGEKVHVHSRRGSVIAPVRFDPGLRPGLAFLTVHFHDQVATNNLTIDAVDPKSGTSEFKATAIRIEKYQEN
jgi:formate dehydrogenase major subunit